MCYAKARVDRYLEELSYRVYVTDSLQLAAQNKYLATRWIERLNSEPDTRTADEVAIDVITRCGLKLGGE